MGLSTNLLICLLIDYAKLWLSKTSLNFKKNKDLYFGCVSWVGSSLYMVQGDMYYSKLVLGRPHMLQGMTSIASD